MGDLLQNLSKDIQKHCKNIDDFNKGLIKDIDKANQDLLNAIGLSKAQQEMNENLKKLLEGMQKPFAIPAAKPAAYNPYRD
jgi:hypothetical protein